MEQTLNEKILACIDEGHVGDSHLSGFDENKAAKSIERLVLREKIKDYQYIKDCVNLYGHDEIKINSIIESLTEKLNQIKTTVK